MEEELKVLNIKKTPWEELWVLLGEMSRESWFFETGWWGLGRHFYSIPHCYEVAYIFGKALLEAFPLSDLITLSRRKRECCRQSEKIYKRVFSK